MSSNIQGQNLGTMLVSSGAAGVMPIDYGYWPAEGSRAVSAAYGWGSQTGYVEDLSQLVARGVSTTIQSAYVDNSQSTQAVTFYVFGTDQAVTLAAGVQAAIPLIFTGAPMLQISVPSTQSGGLTRVMYLNIPLTQGPWSSSIAPGLSGTYQSSPTELANAGTQGLLLDSYGGLAVNTEAAVPTYSIASNVNAVANATDFLTIYGSASKTIRIHEIEVNLPGASTVFSIIRRSTANTGGTSFNFGLGTPHDASDPASTATILSYSVNPTALGTAATNAIELVNVGSTAPGVQTYTYGVTDKALVLRGTGQGICFNYGGSNAATAFTQFKLKWSEV